MLINTLITHRRVPAKPSLKKALGLITITVIVISNTTSHNILPPTRFLTLDIRYFIIEKQKLKLT
jgi:hypothetical protein